MTVSSNQSNFLPHRGTRRPALYSAVLALGVGHLFVAGCSNGTPGDDNEASGGSGDGTGGLISTGGSPATGGALNGSGGEQLGTGGEQLGTGGEQLGTGGEQQGTGGSDSTVGTPGCGSTNPPASGRYSVTANNKQREYILDIPAGYDSDHPYPIVVGWHWRYANAAEVANGENASFGPYYGLKTLAAGSTIFVAPEGLSANGITGWANQNGEDIMFAEAMLDKLEDELCIDTERVFSTGFSFGGMFSYAVGCALPHRFRAIAPISGALWSGCQAGSGAIAMLGMHGVTDGVVQIGPGRDARNEFLSRNGCSNSSTPVSPSGCVSYNDCEEGAPLVWCEYNDGHWPPSYAPQRTWEFFSQF